ncbi:MAG: hypothetical protein AB1942_16050 [Pseudomonadota bacterium]
MTLRRNPSGWSLWWAMHQDKVRAIGIGALFIAALILLGVWLRGGGTVTGHVVRFGMRETDLGTFPVAVVQLEDRLTTVKLTRTHNCRIGDSITIRRRGQGLVGRYNQPCTPPGDG